MDIFHVIHAIAEETKELAQVKNARIEALVNGQAPGEEDTFHVKGEELLCYSMLANLVRNALDAAPEGETVRILLEPGNPAFIRVHNKGEVPAAIRDRFFEKYATSGKKGGTGLGTYSARLIAETQGGGIRLDTTETGATSVIVEMPA